MDKDNFIAKQIGIIGGGQLGKMMINEAAKMGIYTVVLDPSEDCPAACIANDIIVAKFDDKNALMELAKRVDVLTCEFEHISTSALKLIEENGYTVYPKSRSLEIIQNKYNQKSELRNHGIPVGDFYRVASVEDLIAAANEFGFPMMLKSELGGYDGKGNALIRCEDDIKAAFNQLKGDTNPLYVERYVPFVKEISVLCCRAMNGEIAVYPVACNIHKKSILFETSVPAEINNKSEDAAISIATKVCEIFQGVGMFCVEMFLLDNGDVLVNEVAPRPHNSGHYTIEGCITSQFMNHVRAILGLPMGSTELVRPSVMRNILGEKDCDGQSLVSGAYEALSFPGVNLHIYGKKYTKPDRKMGHLTVTANTLEEAKIIAEQAATCVRIISK